MVGKAVMLVLEECDEAEEVDEERMVDGSERSATRVRGVVVREGGERARGVGVPDVAGY